MVERDASRKRIRSFARSIGKGLVSMPEHGKVHNVALKAVGGSSVLSSGIMFEAASSTTDPRLLRIFGGVLLTAGASLVGVSTAESAASNKRRLLVGDIDSVNSSLPEGSVPKEETIHEIIAKAKLLTKKGSRAYRTFRIEKNSSQVGLTIDSGLDSSFDRVQLRIREKPVEEEGEILTSVKNVVIEIKEKVATVKYRNELISSREGGVSWKDTVAMSRDKEVARLDDLVADGSQDELESVLNILLGITPEDEIVDYSKRTRAEVERDKKVAKTIKRKIDNLLAIAKEEKALEANSDIPTAEFDVSGKSVSVANLTPEQKNRKKGIYSITVRQIAGQEGGPFPTTEYILYKDILKCKVFDGMDSFYSSESEVLKGGLTDEARAIHVLNMMGFYTEQFLPTDEQVEGLLQILYSLGISSLRRKKN